MSNVSNHKGFTLLEVIVALTLIATLGLSLFSWINNSLTNIHRIDRHFEAERANANALAWLATVNPFHQPKGSITLGSTKISWDSTLSAPIRQCQAPYSLEKSIYQAGLYSLHVKISTKQREISEFTVEKVGWNQTGTPPEILR